MPAITTTINPSAEPALYPGDVLSVSGVITESWLYPLSANAGTPAGEWTVTHDGGRLDSGDTKSMCVDDLLSHNNYPVIGERHAMLAIGSNASPGQLRHKFSARGEFAIPAAKITVSGLGLGHSAHVSTPGYIPYTAYAGNPKWQGNYLILWLDEDQLAVVTETEPNYVCATLDGTKHRMVLESNEALPSCLIYCSKWGVLRLAPEHQPLPASSQAEIFRRLAAQPPFASLVPEASAGEDAAILALNRDARRRDEVRRMWAVEHLSAPDGLLHPLHGGELKG